LRGLASKHFLSFFLFFTLRQGAGRQPACLLACGLVLIYKLNLNLVPVINLSRGLAMGLYDRDYMRKERKEDDPRIEFSKLPSSLEQRLESLKASLRVIKSQQSMSSKKASNSFVYWLMILALLFLWLFFMFLIFS
jgi:hypothetical protein